jgi:hypothetical protein
MAVNTSKTKFIVFRTRGKRIDPRDCRLLFNTNEIGKIEDPNLIFEIKRVYNEGDEKSYKALGVLLDEYISFDEHISHLCAKIAKSLYCINRIKHFVTKKSLKMLYDAMIHSHLVYCINIYGCANSTALQKLKIKQKEAIRTIANVGYREHTSPLFKQFKILPIEKLIKFYNLKFMHNFAHGRVPLSFADMWITNRTRNPAIELRNADDYYVPAHKMASVKRFPYFQFPKIWNDANIVKRNPSKCVFLKTVQSALLNEIGS